MDTVHIGKLIIFVSGTIVLIALFSYLYYRHKAVVKKLTYFDPLTGGYNFEAFKNYFNKRNRSGYVVAMDIDNFFSIENICGSDTADRIIVGVWDTIDRFLLEDDIYCRLSNDNFAFYLEPRNKGDLEWSMTNLLNKIKEYARDHKHPSLEVVFGCYKCEENDTANIAYLRAKSALKKMDRASRKYIYFYEEEDEINRQIEDLVVHGFKSAMENDEFKLEFQPKFDRKSGKMVGAESLVRWHHENGVLYPKDMLKALEKNGFIYQLDSFVFEKVVALQASRLKDDKKVLPISVNISHRSLYYGNVVDEYRSILHQYKVDSRLVPLEISGVNLSEDSRIIEVTNKFSRHDFSLHIANYGIGNTPLAVLSELDFDTVKIDRKLISNILDIRTGKIIKNIVTLARDLKKKVVVVGVENKAQAEAVKSLAIDEIQGFYYSKPISEETFIQLMERYINEPFEEEREFNVIKRDSITASYNLLTVPDEMLSLMIGTSGSIAQIDDEIYLTSANQNLIRALGIECGQKEKLDHYINIKEYLYQIEIPLLKNILDNAYYSGTGKCLLRFMQKKGSLYTEARVFFKGENSGIKEFYMFLTPNESSRNEHEILSNIPECLMVYRADSEGILQMNDNFLKLLGYENFEEYVNERGNTVSGLLAQKDYSDAKYSIKDQVHGVNEEYSIVYHAMKKDGSEVLLNDHGRLVFDEEKGYVFYSVVGEADDIRDSSSCYDLQKLQYTSTHDGLTGLVNQATAHEMVETILDTHPDFDFAMIVLDIDDFKHVNDDFGHTTGDKVIREFGERISKLTNNNGLCARIGGDEFLILEPLVLEDEQNVVKRIYKQLHFTVDGAVITPSIGISSTKNSDRTFGGLFINADRALYYTKNNGKDSYTIYEKDMLSKQNSASIMAKQEEITFESIKEAIDILDKLSENYMFIMDFKKDRLYNSAKTIRDFCYDEADMLEASSKIGRSIFADDVEMLMSDLEKIRSGEKDGHDFVYRWLDRNLNPVWIRCRGNVIYADGKPRYLVGVVSKINK